MVTDDLQNIIALVQAADASLQQTLVLLLRMRQLAEKAADPAAEHEQRAVWEAEFQALSAELDRVAAETPDLNSLDMDLLAGAEQSPTRPAMGQVYGWPDGKRLA